MKKVIILILFILNSCAISPVKIYNQSSDFIDIEVVKDNLFLECIEIDKKENKSLMTFYAVNDDTIHQFIFRRISETDWCENKIKKAYNELIKNMPQARLVGISPLNREKNDLHDKSVPEKLKKPSYLINWTFIRLETERGCKAYFDTGCDPENYWGGLSPQK